MKRFLLLFILISLNTNVLAEIKTFSVTVREVMGERESKDEVREIAALKARLQAQEQAGVYLEAENFFKQVAVETKDRLDMQDEHRKQIRAITAGVTSHKVTEERWEAESGQFVLYLTCEVTLDTGDVDRQIAELVKDRQKYDDMAKLQEMFAQQQTQIEELRVKLEEATSAQVKEVKEERKAASDALTAVDWFEKGQAAEDEDAKIAAFSRSIALDPNWVNPYRLRGMSYTAKKQFGEAQNDFNLALAIDPNDAKSYFVRGWSYQELRPYSIDYNELEISDYSRAISIDPDFVGSYHQRGIAYMVRAIYFRHKGDTISMNDCLNRAIDDFTFEIKSFGEFDSDLPRSLLLRGDAYKQIKEISKANIDFQRAADLGSEEAKQKLEEMR